MYRGGVVEKSTLVPAREWMRPPLPLILGWRAGSPFHPHACLLPPLPHTPGLTLSYTRFHIRGTDGKISGLSTSTSSSSSCVRGSGGQSGGGDAGMLWEGPVIVPSITLDGIVSEPGVANSPRPSSLTCTLRQGKAPLSSNHTRPTSHLYIAAHCHTSNLPHLPPVHCRCRTR